MLQMLHFSLGSVILLGGLISQANSSSEQRNQNCRDGTQPVASSTAASMPTGSVASSTKPHSVRLSWSPSIPANSAPANTIVGYKVYRRDPGKSYEKVNTELIRNTRSVTVSRCT